MTEEQKIGYRKVIVTLLGQVPIIVALFSPALADKVSPIIDILIRIIIPVIFESGVIAYNVMNVKQKVDLAKVAVEQTKADAVIASIKNGGS